MYKIKVTPEAMSDLSDIVDYIANVLFNPTATSDFLDCVEKCYQDLSSTPLMFEKCRDYHLSELGYRMTIIKNYIMVYKIDAKDEAVYILRFFFGGRKYEDLI